MPDKYTTVTDAEYGYRRLSPIPSQEDLSDFYQSQYPELLEEGEIGASLARLKSDDEKSTRETKWKKQTEYEDIAEYVESNIGTGRLLDVGCGTAEFMSYMHDRNWEVRGVEPSAKIAAQADIDEQYIFQGNIQTFATTQNPPEFDLITLWNVLEHIPNPKNIIDYCVDLLCDNGYLVVKVPNEFNPLQIAAADRLDVNQYWISAPTHINYFDVASINRLLLDGPLDKCWVQMDFPMSLFLLFGRNYLDDSDTGEKCHWERVEFELNIPSSLRQDLYRKLATVGIGRNCLVVTNKHVS